MLRTRSPGRARPKIRLPALSCDRPPSDLVSPTGAAAPQRPRPTAARTEALWRRRNTLGYPQTRRTGPRVARDLVCVRPHRPPPEQAKTRLPCGGGRGHMTRYRHCLAAALAQVGFYAAILKRVKRNDGETPA